MSKLVQNTTTQSFHLLHNIPVNSFRTDKYVTLWAILSPGDVVKTNLIADTIGECTAVLVYRWHNLKFATFHSLHVTVGVGEILDLCPSWSVFPSQIFCWPVFRRLELFINHQ